MKLETKHSVMIYWKSIGQVEGVWLWISDVWRGKNGEERMSIEF